ncbi:MAG: FAD-binding oxidoreductase [Lactococcus chungangensis]
MFSGYKYKIGMAWLISVFVLPLPFIYTFGQGLPALYASQAPAFMFGVIAYVWMLLAIYIGTKPKWIDRLIGLPMAYMIHGILSLVAIILAFLHKEGSPSAGLIKLTGDYAFYLFVALAIYSLVFMAGWLTSRIRILEVIKKNLEKLFKHELSVWLHRLNVIATILVFIHVQLIDYVRANLSFMILFYAASMFVTASYAWAKLKDDSKGYKGKLISNQEIAPNIRELTIRLPKKRSLRLAPGDYVFISFPNIKGMGEPHPFSIANAVGSDKLVKLVIRGDGDFTRGLRNVSAPTDIAVDGGFGMYQSVIKDNKAKQLLIIGGGIGIVPLLSVVDGNENIETRFFYTVTKGTPLIYQDRIAQWQNRQNFQAYCQEGRFQNEQILSILPKDMSNFVVLLGGPANMGRNWKKILEKAGVPVSHIYYEEFSW